MGWKPRLYHVSPAVMLMLNESMAPTAPLQEFIEAYRQDDNLWWALECGHHQNLLDYALEELARCEPAWDKIINGPLEKKVVEGDDGNRSGPT